MTNQCSFPEVFLINLDRRTDRLQIISAACERAEITFNRLSAAEFTPGWVGCGLSHQIIVTAAAQMKLPWVLILEDDAEITEAGMSRFRSLLPTLWETRFEWDRFSGAVFPPYLTQNFGNGSCVLNFEAKLIGAFGACTHFDLLNESAYDLIMSWTPQDGPIDNFYVHHGRERSLRQICSVPFVARQYDSYSDIWNMGMNYSSSFDQNEKWIDDLYQAELLKRSSQI